MVLKAPSNSTASEQSSKAVLCTVHPDNLTILFDMHIQITRLCPGEAAAGTTASAGEIFFLFGGMEAACVSKDKADLIALLDYNPDPSVHVQPHPEWTELHFPGQINHPQTRLLSGLSFSVSAFIQSFYFKNQFSSHLNSFS